jgi:WD40 repeat protein
MKPTAVCALLFCGCALADSVSAPPTLRIETGSHAKTVFAISADAGSKFALTASDDATARLWDLSTGRLVQTFHPASSGSYEGQLYAAAISPDSNMVVFGGRTGRLWSADQSYGFYVYSRRAGTLSQTISGLKGQVTHLAFSQDGQYLAVSTTKGASLYRVSDWSEWPFEDGFWADITSVGQRRAVVVTATEVQLYTLSKDDEWTMVAAVEAEHLASAQASFSPDGKRILVKSTPDVGQRNLDVFSADKLGSQVSLDTGDNAVHRAIFSKDSRLVLGSLPGGRIGMWSADGSGSPEFLTLIPEAQRHEIPIGDLVALGDGHILYTSARSGEWGVAGETPDKTLRVIPNLIDTSVNGIMGLAFDGSEVQYGADPSSHLLFSLSKRTVAVGGTLDTTPGPPQVSKGSQAKSVVHSTDELLVTGGKLPADGAQHKYPVINGVELKTDPPNMAFATCYAVLPDAFYLASEGTLYAYQADGTRQWKTPLGFLPTLVRRSGDSRHIVVAGRDGAFHWISAASGKPEFNAFVSPDGRWVMWTPSGYYDASAGGEDLIGYQVNRDGKGPISDFYGASRFRSRFYRPELFPALLKTGDEAAALRSLGPTAPTVPLTRGIDAGLPPVVTILSPERDSSVSSTTLKLRYSVNSPAGPVTAVSVRIDGRPIPTGRGLTPADNQVEIEIPARDCEVGIIAENSNGASTPGTVRVHWAGAGAAAGPAKPTLFVVAVGVSKYQNPALRLGLPAKDAQDLANAFSEQQGKFYGAVRTQVLVNEQATRSSVLKAISGVRRDAHQGDFVVIFLAGHGAADDSKSFYYLPADADPTDLLTTAVKFSEITEMVSQIQARTVLFVDTCHSGNLNGGRLAAIADINAIANNLSDESVGAVVFTASTGSQYAFEDPSWGNGAFTKALVEGLHGNASDQGEITISTLERWVGKRVSNLTCGKQTPVCAKRVPDFSIANAAVAASPAMQSCAPN